jgi:alpha-D-ribose 1-methylphosphonate 5-triphosphate synthase subunit PhnH
MNANVHASVPAGFSDPVFDSQIAFRNVMNAMARPGSFYKTSIDVSPPDGLPVAAAATLLALCDFETALWVSPELQDAGAIQNYLTFHTGAQRAQNPGNAQFALVDLTDGNLNLTDYVQGIAEYPDRSATIVAVAPSLTGGTLRHLKGPGIQSISLFAVESLPANFNEQWAINHRAFPLGVDVIFCAGSNLLALPRSTCILES